MTRMLLVGLQPEAVDYSDPALPTRYGCKEDSGWTRWRETGMHGARTDKVGQPVRRISLGVVLRGGLFLSYSFHPQGM